MIPRPVKQKALTTLLGAAMLCGVSLASPLPASASTTFPGRNGKIAVTDFPLDCGFLGTVAPNHSIRALSQTDCPEWSVSSPSFSPDGKRIVYSKYAGANWELILQSAQRFGGDGQKLTPERLGAMLPFYLPDGRIAFRGSPYLEAGRSHTYVVRPNGSGLHKLFDQVTNAVSPNGKWFISQHDHKLFLLDRRGRRVRTLVRFHGSGGDPSFSPDSRRIIFTRTTPGEGRGVDLFVIRKDGTHLHRITFGGHSSGGVFSPDGRWVAFLRLATSPFGTHVVAMSLADHSKMRVLTQGHPSQYGSSLAWGRKP